MDEWIEFRPPRSRGVALQLAALLLLSAAIGLMLTVASQNPPGLLSVGLLVFSLLLSLALPLLFYRLYALLGSGYSIGRGGLRLRWGLRQVQLPHAAILDTALATELETSPILPRWRWPGSLVGSVEDPELGSVEYLAAESRDLVLIGTKERVYALSPDNPIDFLAAYRREAERGSLQALKATSVLPSFVLAEAWAERDVRRMLIAAAGLALGLLILVALVAPGRAAISLGFDAIGNPLEAVPGVQLFLLPGLNLALFVAGLLVGLILYRESGLGWLARMVWGGSLLAGLLFLGAVLFILF
jgi:hypothetical protein